MAVTPKKSKIEKFEKFIFRYKFNKHLCQTSTKPRYEGNRPVL